MNKTKIDWCDSTWNPVTGCLHGCEYCYARRIANRFSGGGEKWKDDNLFVLDEKFYVEELEKACPYPYGFKPTLHRYRLDEYTNKKGRNIFVCSMADLFGEWVPDSWIDEVFKACEKAPQHNYLFLTKNPERYIKSEKEKRLPWADNFWFGSSVTRLSDKYAWFTEEKFHWFLSVEPPKSNDYVLLQFANFPVPQVGRYEEDEEGGAYYIDVEDVTCAQQYLVVDAWHPLPEQYQTKGE